MLATRHTVGAAPASAARQSKLRALNPTSLCPQTRAVAARSTSTLERPTQQQEREQQLAPRRQAAVQPPALKQPGAAAKPAGVAKTGGNHSTSGPFAPLVVVTRNIVGEKEFNKIRGKAISLHSQVIKDFGGVFGVSTKQVQGLVRLAKKNGEKLGFLA